MKFILFIFLLVCFCLPARGGDLVSYQYKDAIALARQTDQQIYLVFFGQECPWCDKQKEVLVEEQIVKVLNKYLVVFVDIKEEAELAKSYRVRSIPCHFIINFNEKIIKKTTGYQDTDKLEKFIKE